MDTTRTASTDAPAASPVFVIRWLGPGHYRSDVYGVYQVGSPDAQLYRGTELECAAWIALRSSSPNPVIQTNELPGGWTLRRYANGMHDVAHDAGALSGGFTTWVDALSWLCDREGGR